MNKKIKRNKKKEQEHEVEWNEMNKKMERNKRKWNVFGHFLTSWWTYSINGLYRHCLAFLGAGKRVYIYMYICLFSLFCASACGSERMNIYIYICMYIYIYMYIHIYTFRGSFFLWDKEMYRDIYICIYLNK